MNDYVVDYSRKGSKIPIDFFRVKAKDHNQAVHQAKLMFASLWYTGQNDGEKEAENLDFKVYLFEIEVNGYKIQYNAYWRIYIVWHSNIGRCEDFLNIDQAIHYCNNG